MGKQKIPIAIVCFLASLAIVIFVLVGGEGPRRAEVTVFEEDALPKMYMPRDERERDRPVWLTNYATHLPLISIPRERPCGRGSMSGKRRSMRRLLKSGCGG